MPTEFWNTLLQKSNYIVPTNRFSIIDANRRGLLKIGTRIYTNGDLGDISEREISGVITELNIYNFYVKRDDSVYGSGPDGTWTISRTNSYGDITIVSVNPLVCWFDKCKEPAMIDLDGVGICKKHTFSLFQCEYCGKLVRRSTQFYPSHECIILNDSTIMCDECHVKYHITCNRCGFTYERSDIVITGKFTYCKKCTNKYIVKCSDCIEPTDVNNACKLEDGKIICLTCYEESYTRCGGCDKVILTMISQKPRDGRRYVCNYCLSKYYISCEYCLHMVTKSSISIRKEKRICQQCRDGFKPDIRGLSPCSPVEIKEAMACLASSIPKTLLRTIRGREDDKYISHFIDKIGKVRRPIYIYGLQNRRDYSFMISAPLLPTINDLLYKEEEEYYIDTPLGRKKMVIKDIKNERFSFGIDLKTREHCMDWVMSIIEKMCNPSWEQA